GASLAAPPGSHLPAGAIHGAAPVGSIVMSAVRIVHRGQSHARNAVASATAPRLHDAFVAFVAFEGFEAAGDEPVPVLTGGEQAYWAGGLEPAAGCHRRVAGEGARFEERRR